MQKLLSKLWDKRARLVKADKGFTLIELLVVVVILGVLIAIAIPLYLNYRKGANDAAAQSDLRNAMSVLEVCNTNNGKYPPGNSRLIMPTDNIACTGQTINLSVGTVLKYNPVSDGSSYVMSGSNNNGTSGKFFCYNSKVGGAVTSRTTEPPLDGSRC